MQKEKNIFHKQLLFPKRTLYSLKRTIATSPWATSWPRMHRQVFWLSDGQRDVPRISLLLHKSRPLIEQVVKELTVGGFTSVQIEREELVMDAILLKQSFELIQPQKEAFARSFYQRLFAYYPQTQRLFAQTDMNRQCSSLMATLAAVVAGVERGDNLTPVLQKLGEKHHRYGTEANHYPLVGKVLLETFSEYLGPRFTQEVQNAWSQAYDLISSQMIAAAK